MTLILDRDGLKVPVFFSEHASSQARQPVHLSILTVITFTVTSNYLANP